MCLMAVDADVSLTMQFELLAAGDCAVRDGDRQVMVIMPKFVLKRARPERVVAKRALLVS